jgi:hypothetical protein
MFDEAMENGNAISNSDFLISGIRECKMLLWVIFEGPEIIAACVTEIKNGNRFSALHAIVIAGKKMELWLDLLDRTLYDFGKEYKCQFIEMTGRKGWMRTLNKIGWEFRSVTMAKEIKHG